MKKIKETHKKTYYAIKQFLETHKYSPSIKEICELTNKKSVSTIFEHIEILKENGYISSQDYKARTIKIEKEID